MSAVFSLSMGIFSVVFGELLISGEITDSFKALYAADHAIERALYKNRKNGDFFQERVSLPAGNCYEVEVKKVGRRITQIVAVGQYRCDASARVVKRSFLVNYLNF